jgi:hypothetical protein
MRYVAMRFAVRFLRHQGRSIPWRMIANQSAKIGDLRIQECRDEVLHRYVRAAKLFSPICSGPARWFNTKAAFEFAELLRPATILADGRPPPRRGRPLFSSR